MVKFSCFQTRIHSYKNKKTIRQSAESMKKILEDPFRGQDRMKSSFSEANHEPCVKEEGNTLIDDTDNVADSSPTERDCKSEELESKYNTDSDIVVHKNALIKKSQSLGSGLNWKQRPSGSDGSENEIEHAFSYDGSADRSGKVTSDGTNDHGINPLVQLQEPMPSDSVRATCNFTKNGSMFSIGDQQQSEKEITIKNDIDLSGSGDCTPRTPPGIVKSSSLPSMSSPHRISTTLLPCSRSAEDLKALNSWKYGHHEMGRKMQNEEIYDSISNNEKNKGEAPADGTCETYNYVESAKDWIVPASDGVNMEKGESSYHHWNEMPTENFRLNRIQAWVNELQQSDPLQDSEEVVPCDDHLLPEGDIVLGEPTVSKLEVKVNPGAEAAKRYISSLNASATAAQLTNLGLVVIPFLSAFVSLKALNLSGNAIVRITAGALPRGLHILNLSKNSISTIEGLRDLTRLRVLDLSYNRILRIGHGLAGCSSIKELYLAGNKISEVEGLHRLLKLNVLDLRFNKISTTKCLGQLAANYNCLQALSLEGNPSQKNVGDEQLKKYVQNLLPRLTYYNRQSIKVGTMKDTPSDRSSRLGINGHQVDRGLKVEVKTMRKGTHGIVAQKVSSSSIHGRKSQGVVSSKLPRSRHGRLPPVGVKATTQGNQFANFSSKVLSFKDDLSMRRSRSEGTLGML